MRSAAVKEAHAAIAVLASRKPGMRTSDRIQSAWLHLDPTLAEDASLPARGAAALSNLEPAPQSGGGRGPMSPPPPDLSVGLKTLLEKRNRKELCKRLLRSI